MPSKTRRTTSKSGGSDRSPKKGTAVQAKSSSRTAPASFEAIFGKEPTEEQKRYEALRAASAQRLADLRAAEMPRLALLRTRHKQKIAREAKNLREIEEVLKSLVTD